MKTATSESSEKSFQKGERGVSYPIAAEVLNTLKIGKEDWKST